MEQGNHHVIGSYLTVTIVAALPAVQPYLPGAAGTYQL
jgi:hypothetical protein